MSSPRAPQAQCGIGCSRRFVEYALEKLGEAGEGDIIRDRHRDHFTELAEAIASSLQDGPARLADWADVEIDNLRAAFVRSRENGDLEKALRLASALQYFWLSSARLREGLTWFDAVVTDADEPGVAPEVWVRAVMRKIAIAGWLQDTRGHSTSAGGVDDRAGHG